MCWSTIDFETKQDPDSSLIYSRSHVVDDFSTRIKDAGIAIRHSQEYIISILQGPEMSLGVVCTHLKS